MELCEQCGQLREGVTQVEIETTGELVACCMACWLDPLCRPAHAVLPETVAAA